MGLCGLACWSCSGTHCSVFQWLCLPCTHTHTRTRTRTHSCRAQGCERIWIWIYRFILFHSREVKIMYIFRNYDCGKEKKIQISTIPVGPHKAVAEVSRIGHSRRGELLWCMDGRANPLMDRKVVGVGLFGVVSMVAVVTSLTTPGCSVV